MTPAQTLERFVRGLVLPGKKRLAQTKNIRLRYHAYGSHSQQRRVEGQDRQCVVMGGLALRTYHFDDDQLPDVTMRTGRRHDVWGDGVTGAKSAAKAGGDAPSRARA